MLQSVNDLKGYSIVATDGEIGNIEEFYFDDEKLTVRYLVANIGNWLPGKHVLISTLWLGQINWAHEKVNVNLTRGQIENSPDYDKVKQVSREYETRLHEHYGLKTTG